jgi:bile acid:Na+ symporter, BASS family
VFQTLLNVTLMIFMIGNLLDMGLRLRMQEALAGLRDSRFVIFSVLWGFVVCPAVAWLLVRFIPIAHPHAIGMVLLGMTPCASFLPPMAERTRGDMGYTAAFMLLASVVTVVYLPIAVPFMVEGVSASAWRSDCDEWARS